MAFETTALALPRTPQASVSADLAELSSTGRRRDLHRRGGSNNRPFLDGGDGDTPQDRKRNIQQELIHVLSEHGNGSLLRGWRCELDPTGVLEVDFQDMCKAATRLALSGDPRLLFGEDSPLGPLGIEELAPQQGQLLKRFKAWVKQEFQTPIDMFGAFDSLGSGTVTREMFFEHCRADGFEASDQDLGDIFDCCDWGETGCIVEEDVIFLDEDHEARDLEIFKAKSLNTREWRHQIAEEYLEQYRRAHQDVQQRHRLAPRPWQAKTFEQLPTIACQQRNDRRRATRQREQQAREAFLRHLREIYGSEVRAMRRSLDCDGNFGFTQLALRYYCRKVDLDINPKDLWRALDRDGDGTVGLPELCMKPALALARFQRWAVSTFCTCAAIWETPEAATARGRNHKGSWGSEKKMLFASFAEALHELGWPQVHDHNERSLVFSSLDIYGCGLIMRSDLEWLDKWKHPEWLHAEPDQEGWSNLKGLLIRIYKHPLHAWRRLFDRDNCGQISWPDFKGACTKLRFRGKIAECWRALDTTLNGFITVMEFDQPTAKLLASFKDWAENNFGSVAQCFKKLDDGSGLVAYSDLKRACHKTKWPGDVRSVFDCLEFDAKKNNSCGQRSVSLQEVVFLDAWDLGLKDDSKPFEASEASSSLLSSTLNDTAPSLSSSAQPLSLPPNLSTTLTRSAMSESAPALHSVARPPASQSGAATTLPRTPTTSSLMWASTELAPPSLETSGSKERPAVPGPRKLFPLLPAARGGEPGRSQQGFGLASPDTRRKASKIFAARTLALPSGCDARRTGTSQSRRSGTQEAFFEEERRLPKAFGAATPWHTDGLIHWQQRRLGLPGERLATPEAA
mmetsp:Transcript_26112/g.81439  ORF Transcript_26112/g.81439 Transcript_26112/m.81439 type:complete len:853 (-) Transcript_26112:226-2784(-)